MANSPMDRIESGRTRFDFNSEIVRGFAYVIGLVLTESSGKLRSRSLDSILYRAVWSRTGPLNTVSASPQ